MNEELKTQEEHQRDCKHTRHQQAICHSLLSLEQIVLCPLGPWSCKKRDTLLEGERCVTGMFVNVWNDRRHSFPLLSHAQWNAVLRYALLGGRMVQALAPPRSPMSFALRAAQARHRICEGLVLYLSHRCTPHQDTPHTQSSRWVPPQ